MFRLIKWREKMLETGEGAGAGANAQGIAAPAADSGPVPAEAGENDPEAAERGTENISEQPEPGPMPPEQRHEQAERRRQRELHAAREESKALWQRMDAFAKRQGFSDMDEMERAGAVDKLNRELRERGELSPEALASAMQVFAGRAQAQVQQAADDSAVNESKMALQQEFKDFMAVPGYSDFGIKGISDFAKQPWFDKFAGLLNAGWTITDAFEAVNATALTRKRTEAARQRARNDMNGKDHMKTVSAGAGGLETAAVPADTMEFYRALHPAWDDRRIRNHYARTQKGMTY